MKVKSLAELNNQVKDESIALTNSGFTATLQSGTLSGDVVHTLPSASGALVGGGDQTIAGIKTFSSSPVVPNATTGGQAIRYDQSVKLTGDETIEGIKTFSSSPIVPTPTSGDNTTKIATTEFVERDFVKPTDYATSTVGGTVKARLNGTTLYLTINGVTA